MKKVISIWLIACCLVGSVEGQLTKPIKKSTLPTNTATIQNSTPPASVYSLTSAKASLGTGNDNKEQLSKFFFYIMENNGIWGDGQELFVHQDYESTAAELKVNTAKEFALNKRNNTNPDAFTLTNLQNKGFRFVIVYMPNFFADAWKVETVTLTLEFKDQYGVIHPTMGTRTVVFNISNGILTKSKFIMYGPTDGFFSPLPITITNK